MRFSFFCIPVLALLALPLAVCEHRVVCPILMYHHLVDMGAANDPEMRTWSVNPRDFDAQMAWLEANHYHSVTPVQLTAALDGGPPLPDRPVCITFDDGWAEQCALGWPILQRHGMSATFFVYTAGIDAGGWMSWAQLREMASAGATIECHTINHPVLAGMAPADLRRQLVEPKGTIESRLGRPVTCIAYPYGKFDAAVLTAAPAAGYTCGVSTLPGIGHARSEEFFLRRIYVSNGDPLEVFVQRVRGRRW